MTKAYLHRIGTATPTHDIHETFVNFAADMLADPRARNIFQRLVAKSDILHRYSCLQSEGTDSDVPDAFAFYRSGQFPSTAERMRVFEKCAPVLVRRALDKLALGAEERSRIRHVIVTCCTGFYAPGLDFEILEILGLPSSTERTMVGFMGCYAAMNALKLARHIVRSEAGANMESFETRGLENAREMITWRVGDFGFDMFLSTQVPAHIAKAMKENAAQVRAGRPVDLWAVHPGGRSILDAVESGLALPLEALKDSRCVLSSFGNISSATVMFVLERVMNKARAGQNGCAMSFGPGVAAEIMRFHAL